MQATRTTLAFASLALASGAFAQSTSTTMDMGGGMTHVDTMGPNGAMSSSNCMSMGGGMTSCQTMDMSQPQRTYTTPDMSRPQRPYSRPDVSEPEPSYSPPYVSRWPVPVATAPLAPSAIRAISSPVPAAPTAQDNRLIAPAPMSLVSTRPAPIPEWARTSFPKAASGDDGKNDTEYTVSYLGHAFSLTGPKGLAIADLRSGFDQAWRDNPWVEYSSTPAGTVYFFSITSERLYADRIEVWTKADHSRDRTTKARTTMALFEIRCTPQKIRELQQTQYGANGQVLRSFDQPDALASPIPETVGSDLFNEICKIEAQ
ncbi:hypothetical protein Sphch_0745 [Sphingobium chlorophenolicum L-1]|uniref:Surface-adhesin protein E-like domain-containing protein n=1 Tax=Sphingobium chlorophenolicum L-1 TaxID=690566 RepID=F6EZG4_SPHCR|nr:surface-adhesin E family protein [Sphingobium chlorophenolicum]AEG48440.1 hypothetical protein Sphch_0745 [Sphingobium chlorophenolicum L-1]